jgi:translation initiation factor 3 subunit A
MYKYVDLAVEMKQARKIKDALINYRNACQQVNVTSLGDVIEYLVEVASSKAEEASQEAQAIVGDIGDLEAEDSPEEMILSFVSGEKSADRTDREVVMPWFKLLWETHRNVLDVLRNNSRLEGLYATAAKRTFGFCVTYKRTTEFRRLCDILRNHLGTLIKYKDQQGRDRTDLGVPATWESYIDVRFEQLKTACTLELWAEAFRSVEDIQGLVGSPPKGIKGPKASLMATYYARLTQIFTRSEARLYNAYAWYRLFTFSRSFNKGLTQDDLVAMASNVVLSALSVLPYDRGNTAARGYDIRPHEKENSARMAAILGFNGGFCSPARRCWPTSRGRVCCSSCRRR